MQSHPGTARIVVLVAPGLALASLVWLRGGAPDGARHTAPVETNAAGPEYQVRTQPSRAQPQAGGGFEGRRRSRGCPACACPEAETTLREELGAVDATELLVCGMMTQNCVTHTAISRSAEPYDVTILPDCCTTVDDMLHNIALHAVSTRVKLVPSVDAIP